MILVVGATGFLGGLIAQRLRGRGEQVRVLVRKTSAYQPLQEAGAELAFGDLKQPKTLAPACEGVTRLITTASATLRGGEDTIESVDLHGTHHLIDAAAKAGVEQFVYVSAFGLGGDVPHPLGQAKGKNEAHLRASGMNCTILKPVMFMESWIGFVIGSQLQQGPAVTIVGDGHTKYGFVAMENVADLAIAALGHPAAQNAEIQLNGPKSVSYREVIGLIEKATGQAIQIDSVSPGEAVPGLPPLVSELWGLFEQAGDLELDSSDVARTYGLNLINVETFIQSTFAGQG